MASRNERRRKARQRAQTVRGEAGHGDIDGVGATLIKSAERIHKAAQTRQTKTKATDVWDPEKTVPPPLPPDALWSIFEQNSYHSGCINAKVTDAVGRGWKLDSEDDTEEGASDDVDRLTRELTDLLDAITPKLTFRQLCETATRELDAIGWADWEILRDRDGDVTSEIVGILPVPAYTIRACKDTDDVFVQKRAEKKVYFKRFGFEQQVNCDTGDVSDDVPEDKRANEIVHFQHYSPRSSWYGIPPWVSAMPAIAEFGAIREFNVSFFESGGQADRLVHVSSSDEDNAKRLADVIVKQLEDSRGEAHVSLVTHSDDETAVDVTPLEPKRTGAAGGGGRDSSFRGGKEDLKEEIRVAHQVPPGRLGIAEAGALAGNANDSMDDDYRIGVVEPLQEIVEAVLRRTVFGELGFGPMIAGWTFAFEDRTQDDTQDEHDRTMEAKNEGVITPNEARTKLGEKPVEDPALDRHYIGSQPISTDPAITDVAQLLSELRDALRVAVADKPDASADKTVPGNSDEDDPDAPPIEKTGLRRWVMRRLPRAAD